jgi:energy-coupling factor transporter ATP-binding protein EcfA2
MSEELWYPEFGFRRNPFANSDRLTEIIYEERRVSIVTKAVRQVESLIKQKMSAIIVGPKGCGKSTAAEITNGENYLAYTTIIGSFTMKELICTLLEYNYGNEDREIKKKVLTELDAKYGYQLQRWLMPWYDKKTADGHGFPTKYLCKFESCPRKTRCEFPRFEEITFGKVVGCLPERIICPFAQWIAPRIFGESRNQENVFLFDVPDEIGVDVSPRYFKDFIQELRQETRGVVILMATNQQYNAMIRTEYFKRWNRRYFPKMESKELKMIYEGRLESDRVGDSPIKFKSNPLTEEALDYIILTVDHNPRNMIRNVGLVLERMAEEGRKMPADLNYVMTVLKNKGGFVSDSDALEDVLGDLRGTGVSWVKVRVIRGLMEKRGVKISDKRLGRIMKGKGFPQRNNYGSEYRVQ